MMEQAKDLSNLKSTEFTEDDHDRDDSQHTSNQASEQSVTADKHTETFVKRETRYVFLLRVVVLAILVCAAVAISVVVLNITQSGEKDNFESQYSGVGSKITETFQDIFKSKMGAAASLTVAEVAYGQDTAKTWPFVTMSSFQQRAATVKSLSGALFIGMNPIVDLSLRQKWQFYTNNDDDGNWYEEGLKYQSDLGLNHLDTRPLVESEDLAMEMDEGNDGIAVQIFSFDDPDDNLAVKSSWAQNQYLPVWQTSPVTKRTIVNEDLMGLESATQAIQNASVVFERMQFANPGYGNDTDSRRTSEFGWLLSMANEQETMYQGDVFSSVYFPLYNHFDEDRRVVGIMRTVIQWGRYFANVLPASDVGVVLVLENGGCDEPYTYKIQGDEVFPLGRGDLHDSSFDEYEMTATMEGITKLNDGTKYGMSIYQSKCPYSIRVYPSQEFYDSFITEMPVTITSSVAAVFAFAIIMFFLYDRLVEWRQTLIVAKATQTHDIVASLFPKNVRDRMLDQSGMNESGKKDSGQQSSQVKNYLDGHQGDSNEGRSGAPIADLFPNATVFFADIAGFTAWSSTREPPQIFTLLETLYGAFDKIASRRKVFKIETIGDSYVAVTGLPEPQPKHAIIMARFAADVLNETMEVTRKLERSLGPETGNLSIRIGLNSGPVTAGVLRGDRARFQLFGDTVNTAARMESTGMAGFIQASESTANELILQGKRAWIKKRDDDVMAKGKGVLQTFWVDPQMYNKAASSVSSENDNESEAKNKKVALRTADSMVLKQDRLVDWMTSLLADYVKRIITKHSGPSKTGKKLVFPKRQAGKTNLDEVTEAIKLPEFDHGAAAEAAKARTNLKGTALPDPLMKDLRSLVTIIAAKYRNNPFHNFEHACHVTMNTSKFLNRIVNPDVVRDKVNMEHMKNGAGEQVAAELASHLHDYTHGLNSDPITMFGIVFSALIHDVDHRGVSNTQMMKEDKEMGEKYRGKSVAEQNSLDIAWDLLASSKFSALREAIFTTQEEILRFRQVIVNIVLATDIFDPELNGLRKKRWEMAFSDSGGKVGTDNNELRATVVMEHIIQASDVCHTMQHWHIYRKWNKHLFQELLLAYRSGRMEKDPSEFWYKGELGFFDNYIIPLARKLATCKVFGVSSDECLNYALKNRAEWEDCGQQIVADMIEEFKNKDP